MVTSEQYAAAEGALARMLRLPYGKKQDADGSWYNVGPRWTKKPAEAMALLLEHTSGYREAQQGTPDHCFVIQNYAAGETVVYLRDHVDKMSALGFAAVLAAIVSIRQASAAKKSQSAAVNCEQLKQQAA